MTASGTNCDIRPDEKYFDKNLLSVEVSLGNLRLYVNAILPQNMALIVFVKNRSTGFSVGFVFLRTVEKIKLK